MDGIEHGGSHSGDIGPLKFWDADESKASNRANYGTMATRAIRPCFRTKEHLPGSKQLNVAQEWDWKSLEAGKHLFDVLYPSFR